MRARRTIASLAAVLAISGCAAEQPEPTAAPAFVAPTPTTVPGIGAMAVLGDSITLGVSACGSQEACPQYSWAFGTEPELDSIAMRIAEPGDDYGVESVDLVASTGADLVLVLLGANDACKPTFDEITPPEEFAVQYRAMLAGIAENLPDAAIVALSVPDVLRLWELGHTDPVIAEAWGLSPSCRSLLWNAASQAQEDIDRRAAVDATITAYNEAIAASCAELPQCVSDDGAIHAVRFEPEHVSSVDSFHPSPAGQAALAAAAWPVVEEAISAD